MKLYTFLVCLLIFSKIYCAQQKNYNSFDFFSALNALSIEDIKQILEQNPEFINSTYDKQTALTKMVSWISNGFGKKDLDINNKIFEIIKLLLNEGANVNLQNPLGHLIKLKSRFRNIIELLLIHEADPNQIEALQSLRTQRNFDALRFKYLLKLLLLYGANYNLLRN